jgi:hypothetical protein
VDGGDGFNIEYVQYPSPDFTRTIYRDRNAWFWALYDATTGEILSEFETTRESVFSWSQDSQRFLGEISDESKTEFVLFDSEGNEIETVFDVDGDGIRTPHQLVWSPEKRYVALNLTTLHILDFERREVIDTCLTVGKGMSWSPDNTQLAFTQPGSYITADVRILDIATWSMHAVARHIVNYDGYDIVIGWRNE